ncbi:hypothetical protein KC360_g9215 [Hortaea werneckii]|nr:hypothetical protein KC325_g6743 [Hortaea werneckii]KAI6992846.1 hypothetical protein KC359_g5468 [Hortaea werneckii]KAI7139603.1 hypothetical protein KC344_g9212 [Hortaea werneckii]KAI7166249.1 hypothetical protein KC360_g9215 [Hortaea werneckii]KAI7513485.1 hypothetical protein KC347_g1526 [Hortaea werneckii]
MLAIKSSPRNPHQPQQSKPLHPNILPCAIHHSGPIKVSKRYWSPTITTPAHDDGTAKLQTAHFRGRKLQGRRIRLPEGYIGRILQKTEEEEEVDQHSTRPQREGPESTVRSENADDADEDGNLSRSAAPVKMLETKGTFDSLTIWGHDHAPLDGEEDEFARGIGEWIGFAEAIHTVS